MTQTKDAIMINASIKNLLEKVSINSLKSDTEIKSFFRKILLHKDSKSLYSYNPFLIKNFTRIISDFINSGDKFFLSDKAYYKILNSKDKIPVFSKDILENPIYSIRDLIPSKILVYYLLVSEDFSEDKINNFIFSLRNRILISKEEEKEFLKNYSIIRLNCLFQQDFNIDNIFLKQLTGINIHSQSIKFI